MNHGLHHISATVTIAGSVLFLVAAFLPISYRVFPEPNPVMKLEVINRDPGQWFAAQLLFALGTVVTVCGIGLYAYFVREEGFAALVWASVALLTVGAGPWLWQVYARTVDPASFAEGSLPMWPYLFYFFATELGLALFGIALLSAPVPPWLGWGIIASMAMFAILTIVFRDLAPFAFYVVTLLTGVMLYNSQPLAILETHH